MPNRASHNGSWSGDDRNYVIVKVFRSKKEIKNAETILAKRYYYYKWSDGWGANITVSEIDSKQAAKLRKKSHGFCGYDWMVTSICDYGEPLSKHEIEQRSNMSSSDNVI